MAQTRINITNNGQEVQISDLNTIAQAAAQADDQVLVDIFRLEPYNVLGASVASKAILPYGIRNAAGDGTDGGPLTAHATVVSNSNSGSVLVLPFKAVVGSRTALGSATNLTHWTDVRSQFYVGTSNTVNGTVVAIAANASGNPRWDLIYCAVAIDGATANVVRFVKNPTTKVVSQVSLSVSLATTTSIAVVNGATGASPALPSLPTDAAGVWYIPLAYIWVPNGFGGSSNVAASNIRDAAPTAPIARTTGALSCRPANGNNDGAGTYAGDPAFQWNALSGVRPSVFMPPAMVGGEELLVELDLTTSGHFSHGNGSIIDNSTDWRNRVFWSGVCYHATQKFGNDTTSTSNTVTLPSQTGSTVSYQMSNSMQVDGGLVSSAATVCSVGASAGIYVDPSSGALKAFVSGTPGIRAFVWIRATTPMPNR